MSIEIARILDGTPGVKKDGGAYILSEDIDVNAFISLGNEVLQIPRLARIEVATDLVTLFTHKSERFYFEPDRVVGFKFGGPESKHIRGGAGFGMKP